MEPSNYCCHLLAIAVGLIVCVNIVLVATKSNPSLVSLTVMFRHGDRLPQPYPIEFYPTDPYLNRSFHPIEVGGLTNEGKMREYQIGKFLRTEYDDFLGEFYRTSDVLAMSSDVDRTKQSLLLALAGLYPPQKGQTWNNELNWQPIPFRFTPSEIDMGLYVKSCPRHEIELARIKKTREYRMAQVRFAPLMKELTVHIGREVNDTSAIYYLYLTLKAESSMGLELPEWTKSYFPDGPLNDVALFQYDVQSFTPLLKKLNGGVMVRKFLNGVKPIVEHSGNDTPKVNLYSVHETHIAGIMKTLKLWNDVLPEFSSAVIFELHEISSKYFVRILYYKGIPSVSEVQVLPGCEEYCPYEDFVKLTKDVVPDDIMEACLGPPENSLLVPRGEDPVKWMYQKFRSWFQFKK